jgi:DNA replication protein DnaC
MFEDSQHKAYADRASFNLDGIMGRAPVVFGCETPQAAAVQAERDRKIIADRAAEEEQRRQAKAFRNIASLPITKADQDRIVTRTYEQTPMLETVREWAEGGYPKPWLMLCGPVGRGKTFSLAAWLAAIERRSVAYVGARELERLSMSKFGDGEAAFKALLDVHVLAIDDIGREDDVGRMQTALLDLVDMRRRAGLATALATNFSRKAFCERYSDARLQSRLAECAQWFADVGDDMRRAKP